MKTNKAVLEINLSQAEQGLRDALECLEAARNAVVMWQKSVQGAREDLIAFLKGREKDRG